MWMIPRATRAAESTATFQPSHRQFRMSTDPELVSVVRKEVESLHEFFVGWFRGTVAEDTFEAGFVSRMSPDITMIPPAGLVLSRDALAENLKTGYGKNPDFRIVIRNVVVRKVFPGYVLATYEEWQRGAQSSKPADNARIATALFTRSEPLTWLHLHETWMPPASTPPEAFDF